MEWTDWIGKKVFVQLRTGACYSGIVKDVDTKTPPLIFLFLKDKYGLIVTIVHSEITKIVEET